ncbi:MAG: uracil-xanthine permease family protein [Lachnospirales bacterium]
MNNGSDRDLLYQLNGRPKFLTAYPMGLQHVIAMFASNLAPIFIIAGIVGLEDADRVLMIQCAMFASGITTLVQLYPIRIGKITIGGNLPIVMGTSFAFVATASAVGVMGIEAGLEPRAAMALVLTGAFFGAIAELLLGSVYKYVKNIFTPLVVGSVLLTIGINLLTVGSNYFAGGAGAYRLAEGETFAEHTLAFGSPLNLFLGFLTFFCVIIFQRFGKGIMKAAAILFGMIIGFIVAIPLGAVNFSSVTNASLVSIPLPLQIGMFPNMDMALSLRAIALFIVVYLISGIETIGNTSGITVAAFDRKATSEETSGALIADACGSMFASLFNSLPNTAFGQNAGLVAMTKVINKWAIALGAFTLIVASFMPKLGALFNSIPSAVLGGGVITVFAMIMMNGIKLIAKAGLDGRNGLIFAIIFGLGFGLGGNHEAIAGLPTIFIWIFEERTAAVFIVSIIATLLLSEKGALKGDAE